MDSVESSGKAFVEFWGRAAAKGDMNKNTAGTLRAAAQAVLETEGPGWETLDVRTLDIDRMLRRFANRAAAEMKQSSVLAYQRRFRQAYDSFLSFIADPAGWHPPVGGSGGGTPSKRERPAKKTATPDTGATPTAVTTPGPNAIEYPYALRGGAFVARFRLPMDLTKEEAKRLTIFLDALVVDSGTT
jgi:hypothetical protein